MTGVENKASGIFPLNALKGSEPTEQLDELCVWRGQRRIRVNGQLVGVTLSAQKGAIDSGNGTFSIEFTSKQKNRETWNVMTSREDQLLDLYLQRTSGPSILLPQVSEATKIARVYYDKLQLFSKYKEEFTSSDVMQVLTTISKVTQATAGSSKRR